MISRKFICKIVFCFSLFVITFQDTSAQEKPKPFTLNDILVNLTFTSRINKTVEQINDKLIEQINERKVNFELSKDDEQKIKKSGGNLALIKAIKSNFLETRSPEMIEQAKLYEKFIACYSKTDIESKILCLALAKEFVQKYENNFEVIQQIDYFKGYITHTEKLIKLITEPCRFHPRLAIPSASEEIKKLYIKLLDCSKKSDLEVRKSCIAIAKEFIQRAGEEHLSGEQIDEVKKYIERTEEFIEEKSNGS